MRKLYFIEIALSSLLQGHGPQSTLNPAGTSSAHISHLSWFVYIVLSSVAVVMFLLPLLVLTRPRGNFSDKPSVASGGGHEWIFGGGVAVPLVILAVIFFVSLRVLSGFPVDREGPTAAEIRVTGHQWWWQVEYIGGPVDQHLITANEIHIPTGRSVNIDLVSDDVIHSFWVPSLHGKVDLVPGRVNRVRIDADNPGVYSGQCGEYCGMQHAHMKIVVVAQAPQEYQQWLARQRDDAAAPATPQEIAGEQVFLSRPCGFCHTIRGTMAGGRVGPDLTHFGSRLGLASNTLPNTNGNLEAWVMHAQSIKPGAKMPSLTQFNGEQLQDVAAYLRALR